MPFHHSARNRLLKGTGHRGAGGFINFGLFGIIIDSSACNRSLEGAGKRGDGGLINLGLFGTQIDFQNFKKNGKLRGGGGKYFFIIWHAFLTTLLG